MKALAVSGARGHTLLVLHASRARRSAFAVHGPAIQHHALMGAGPSVLQEGSTWAPHALGTRTQSPFTQGHKRLGIHQRVAAGEHRGSLQKLALLPWALLHFLRGGVASAAGRGSPFALLFSAAQGPGVGKLIGV